MYQRKGEFIIIESELWLFTGWKTTSHLCFMFRFSFYWLFHYLITQFATYHLFFFPGFHCGFIFFKFVAPVRINLLIVCTLVWRCTSIAANKKDDLFKLNWILPWAIRITFFSHMIRSYDVLYRCTQYGNYLVRSRVQSMWDVPDSASNLKVAVAAFCTLPTSTIYTTCEIE